MYLGDIVGTKWSKCNKSAFDAILGNDNRQALASNIKMTQYADNLTLMLSDKNSINEALSLLQKFGEYSGLRVNTDKTIGMLLGAWKNQQDLPNNINLANKPI